MKITRLTIEGFRTHTHTVLDLAGSVNVVTGANDAGKSNVIRAIEWLCYNTPATASVIQQGQPFARVSADLENGVTVVRVRGKLEKVAVNRYTVCYPEHLGGHSIDYDAIGREVPEAVRELLGVSYFTEPGEVTPCGLNISRQQEQSFLLGESGPKRAALLNVFTGATYLDGGGKALKTEERDMERGLVEGKKRQEALAEEIGRYAYLAEAGTLLDRLEGLFQRVSDAETRRDRLTASHDELESLDKCLEAVRTRKTLLLSAPDGRDVLGRYQSLVDRVRGLAGARECLEHVARAQERLAKQQALLAKAPDISRLLQRAGTVPERAEALSTALARLDRIAARKRLLAETVQRERKAWDKVLTEYADALVQAGVCPVCNGKPQRKTIERGFQNGRANTSAVG